jgi:4-hydroxymandelate oxidase
MQLSEIEAAAIAQLDDAIVNYIAQGSADGVTVHANREAWSRVALRPNCLVDVAERDVGIELLGRRQATPLFVAPTALNRLAHPEGELAVARAAARADVTYCLSTAASVTLAELAEAAPGLRRWSQMYILRDRGMTAEHVRRAVDAAYEALVLTVDTPVLSIRDNDARSGLLARRAVGAAAAGAISPAEFTALMDPSVSWRDLEWLIGVSEIPVLVKGVLRADDALRALDAGAAGVIVSNHGGRQLDGAVATAVALPEIAESLAGRIPVLVDGGVRRGTDIVKAFALGAGAVGIGRPILWGLALAGELGAEAVIARLLRELAVALALCGAPVLREAQPDLLVRP